MKIRTYCGGADIILPQNFKIRYAFPEDSVQMLDIYAPYVTYTTVSFEYFPPTLEEFKRRVNEYSKSYPWIVCELSGEIIGYAYASPHTERPAYQWTADVSVYVREKFYRHRIATALYHALLGILKLQRIYIVYACVTLPNVRSSDFHKSAGFNQVAVFPNAGYKFGEWHGVQWMEKILLAPVGMPKRRLLPEDISSTETDRIFKEAESICYNNII